MEKQKILSLVKKNPGMYTNEIAKVASERGIFPNDLPRGNSTYSALCSLESDGEVRSEKRGRRFWYPT